jgi:hypothetical protein
LKIFERIKKVFFGQFKVYQKILKKHSINFKLMLSFSKIKYFLLTIFGFSLAGGLWGFECFLGTVGSDEVISNPFSFILGALFLGFFGNLSLIFFLEKDFKKILKFLFLGIFCWLISFLIVGIFAHPLWMIGGIITFLPELFFDIGTIEKYISLQPSLDITYFWLEFLISGIIVSLFLSFWLKLRKKL